MSWSRRTTLVSTLLVLIALALGSTAEAQTSRRGGTLRIAQIGEPPTLDPSATTVGVTSNIGMVIFETPFAFDASWRPQPMLVESHTVSPDARTYTFRLRRGVLFHNGKEMGAEDVAASLIRWGKVGSRGAVVFQNVEAVTVQDKSTVVMRLKEPFAPLLAFLALPSSAAAIMPKEIAEATPAGPVTEFIGTGPFRFVEWVPDSHLTLERFPGYWDPGKPYLDRIVYRVVPDPTVRITMVRTGEVDIATDVDAKDVPTLARESGIKVSELKPPARWTALQWWVDKPPFDNKALRQAIALAIDRSELREIFLRGFGEPARGPVVPGVWWFNPTLKGFGYDAEQAKKKLAEAGYPNGFRYKFTVSNTPQWIRQAELIQEQLRKINVTMEFELVNPADSYALVVQKKTNWTHTNWTQRGDPHGLLYILFHSKGFANTTGYSNPRVDELLDRAATIFDPERRKPLYHDAERIIVDDAPYVFLNYTGEFAVMNRTVQNWKWVPDLVPRFRELWLEK